MPVFEEYAADRPGVLISRVITNDDGDVVSVENFDGRS